jgi:hypothetical protein
VALPAEPPVVTGVLPPVEEDPAVVEVPEVPTGVLPPEVPLPPEPPLLRSSRPGPLAPQARTPSVHEATRREIRVEVAAFMT